MSIHENRLTYTVRIEQRGALHVATVKEVRLQVEASSRSAALARVRDELSQLVPGADQAHFLVQEV